MEKTVESALTRFDERDNVQARYELIPGTPEWEEYYRIHPEKKEKDMEQQSLPGVMQVGHELDIKALAVMGMIAGQFAMEEFVDGPVAPDAVKMSSSRAAIKVKGFARHLGADLVGIGPLRQEFVYSHTGKLWYREQERKRGDEINLPHKNAIVLVKGLDFEIMKGAPKVQAIMETVRAYHQLAVISVSLARYLRSIGYPARAHNLMNYQVIVPPVAIDAGLGELGRHGVLITREFGSAIKMAVVTTDLPMDHDRKTDLRVDDFCKNCKICAENCPSNAINFGEKRVIRGVERYPFNAEACYKIWNMNGSDCGVCIATCPWGKPPSLHHALGMWLATKGGKWPGIILSKLERWTTGHHDPGAHKHPEWMEEQDATWEKLNFSRNRK